MEYEELRIRAFPLNMPQYGKENVNDDTLIPDDMRSVCDMTIYYRIDTRQGVQQSYPFVSDLLGPCFILSCYVYFIW